VFGFSGTLGRTRTRLVGGGLVGDQFQAVRLDVLDVAGTGQVPFCAIEGRTGEVAVGFSDDGKL
jgi:hypothetical protein